MKIKLFFYDSIRRFSYELEPLKIIGLHLGLKFYSDFIKIGLFMQIYHANPIFVQKTLLLSNSKNRQIILK